MSLANVEQIGTYTNRRNDGVIYTRSPEVLDAEVATTYIKDLTAIVGASDGGQLILTDLTDLTSPPSSEAQTILSQGMKPLRDKIAKSAVCGIKNVFIRMAVRLIISIGGRADIKIFNTREEAEEYLKS